MQRALGIHLILIPQNAPISSCKQRMLVETAVECAADKCSGGIKFVESWADDKHLHILIASDGEGDIGDVITEILSYAKALEYTEENNFGWSDEVHVTILPPWHLEIMASFVRDQDRYHETRSIEDELNDVFRPNSPPPKSLGVPDVIGIEPGQVN